MPWITLKTSMNAPVEICFDLSRSIDLHQLSTAHTREKAVAGLTSGLIGLDEYVTWRASHFFVRQNLTSKITGYERPLFFRDEMIQGAFECMEHDHFFYRYNGSTTMIDVFYFRSPFGLLGRIFDFLILKRYLKKLLFKRNELIRNYAQTDLWKSILPH